LRAPDPKIRLAAAAELTDLGARARPAGVADRVLAIDNPAVRREGSTATDGGTPLSRVVVRLLK
jgi:hypothetical protein